jgi:hypothetical protein
MLTFRKHTSGTTTIEVLVAFTLLISVLSLSTPLVVKHGRLLTAQREYRLALDELSNQLERLVALPGPEIAAAVERLAPSEFITARLSSVELRGQFDAADFGRRITLRLTWDEPERSRAPVTLAAWILSPSQAASEEQATEEQP